MFHQKCACWDTSGFQEVLIWDRFSTINVREAERFIGCDRKDLQIDFSRETFFGRFLGTPPSLPRNVSIQNPPPPPPKKKKRFLFGLGRPILDMLPRWQIDDLFQEGWSILESHHVQQIINCKNRYCLGVRETLQDKTPPPKRLKDVSREKVDLSQVFPK